MKGKMAYKPGSFHPKHIIVRPFLILAVCVLLFAAVLAAFCRSEINAKRRAVESRMVQTIDLQKSIIVKGFDFILSDLLYLSGAYELQAVLDGIYAKGFVAADYASFMKRRGIYSQIGFLDKEGMEVIRVNAGRLNPCIVPDEELQDKGDRDYVREIGKLRREEIFVSPFDLNRERGAIEEPAKPVIRFGTPVFDRNNKKRGMVVLNYLGSGLIADVRRIGGDNIAQTMLLNDEGYWLISPDPADEWGFMYTDGADKTFSRAFPEAGERVMGEEAGKLYNADGLFVFSAVYPLLGSLGVRSDLRDFSKEIPGWTGAKEYAWKLVAYVPAAALRQMTGAIKRKYILLFVLPIISLGLLSYIFLAAIRHHVRHHH